MNFNLCLKTLIKIKRWGASEKEQQSYGRISDRIRALRCLTVVSTVCISSTIKLWKLMITILTSWWLFIGDMRGKENSFIFLDFDWAQVFVLHRFSLRAAVNLRVYNARGANFISFGFFIRLRCFYDGFNLLWFFGAPLIFFPLSLFFGHLPDYTSSTLASPVVSIWRNRLVFSHLLTLSSSNVQLAIMSKRSYSYLEEIKRKASS